MKFYDSNSGKLLFTAPVDRSWDDFLEESRHHGWPSFRDQEVRSVFLLWVRWQRPSPDDDDGGS
jgi:hypothetical protein